MRKIIVLAFILFLCYFGYHYFSYNHMQAQQPAQQPPQQQTQQPPQQKAQCPCCGGKGFYLIGNNRMQRKEVCSICLGYGYKLLPGDVTICDECGGMGRVEDRPSSAGSSAELKKARICPACNGRGYLIPMRQNAPPPPLGLHP